MNLIEGYRTMFYFLETYYWKNKSDELGGLLGSMSLLPDNTPVDSAYEEDWKIAVSQIIGQREIDFLSSDTVYWAMITFLHNWSRLGTDGTISGLCENLEKSNPESAEWLVAVKTVLKEKDDPYLCLVDPLK